MAQREREPWQCLWSLCSPHCEKGPIPKGLGPTLAHCEYRVHGHGLPQMSPARPYTCHTNSILSSTCLRNSPQCFRGNRPPDNTPHHHFKPLAPSIPSCFLIVGPSSPSHLAPSSQHISRSSLSYLIVLKSVPLLVILSSSSQPIS